MFVDKTAKEHFLMVSGGIVTKRYLGGEYKNTSPSFGSVLMRLSRCDVVTK